jgi:competence ComEA-like helix-hairpin-helix protein
MPDEQVRALAIVISIATLSAVGLVSLRSGDARAPAPCGAPALVGDVIRCDGQGEPVGARAWLVSHKLDVNTARRDDLTALPRVGPSLAEKILDERARRGGFRSVEELHSVKGIGPKTLARLAPLLTVEAPPRTVDEEAKERAPSRATVDGPEEPADVAAP